MTPEVRSYPPHYANGTSKTVDCPNCRKRRRKWVRVGDIDFCSVACAFAYADKMDRWIVNSAARLRRLELALESMQQSAAKSEVQEIVEEFNKL